MRNRGQGLVEFALVIPLVLLMILAMVDIGPFVFDYFVAKDISAKAARAASIYRPDGYRTCLSDAVNAAGTQPMLMRATWALSMSAECDANPLSTVPRRTPVTATVNVVYHPIWWGQGPWEVNAFTIDQAR